MKDQNIELPTMPHLPLNDPAAAYRAVHDYSKECATAAIEPYAQRIAELESQLESIGAGGVTQGKRLVGGRRSEPVARVNDDGFIVETGLGLAPGTLLYTAPQPAYPAREPGNDERAAQGLPPYSPRHLTEEEWNRLTENGRKAWGKKPDELVSYAEPDADPIYCDQHGEKE